MLLELQVSHASQREQCERWVQSQLCCFSPSYILKQTKKQKISAQHPIRFFFNWIESEDVSFDDFLLSAEEVLRSSRGEGLETMTFWGRGLSERRVHLGILGVLRESRWGMNVDLGNWAGENLTEERRVAVEEDAPPAAAIEIAKEGMSVIGCKYEWIKNTRNSSRSNNLWMGAAYFIWPDKKWNRYQKERNITIWLVGWFGLVMVRVFSTRLHHRPIPIPIQQLSPTPSLLAWTKFQLSILFYFLHFSFLRYKNTVIIIITAMLYIPTGFNTKLSRILFGFIHVTLFLSIILYIASYYY